MNEFGRWVIVGCGVYVAVLLVIGGVARRAKRADDLSDHFLAGRSLGFTVLLLTLFATQYSGNSLSAFPGQTYREGLSYFMSVTFMVGIVSGYLLFAPKLFSLARERRFLTPTDFIHARFGSPTLSYLSAAILAMALCNYMLAQLMALGHAFSGITGNEELYVYGVFFGGLVVLGYELLGGMRAVAWTDALQGVMLGSGVLLILVLLVAEVGGPATVIAGIAAQEPAKVASPSLQVCLLWVSNFLLLGLGAPLYPMAIQRIYAARRLGELRKAMATMAFLPLVAITAVVFMGIVGIYLFPGLERIESDETTFKVLAWLVDHQALATIPVLMVMLAVVAAIMSTADSCLLSLASIFTKDFAARLRGLSDEQAERLTGTAWVFSIAIMAGLMGIALFKLTTLWGLLVVKFEILIQLSPAFVLGTLHDRDSPRGFGRRDILAGLAAGLLVALTLYAAGYRVLHGMHAGTLGVFVNYGVCWLSRRIRLSSSASPAATA